MTRAQRLRTGDTGTPITRRELNRALLARQMLLDEAELAPLDAIAHLVGMQAQAPLAPYVGLWSRLRRFRAEELARLIEERRAVRMPLMRTTLHLVTADDAMWLRSLMQPMLVRVFQGSSPFGRRLAGMDIEAVLAAGRALCAERPRSNPELARALGGHWPDAHAESLGQAVRLLVPMVQPPPRGIWGKGGLPVWIPLDGWLARRPQPGRTMEELALRYLGAFGPASVADFQAWSWLTRQAGLFERLRPQLAVFRDENGRELFDLPDAPRPGPDARAPVRFVPEYDNLLLSHADRARIVAPEALKRVFTRGALLVDGFVTAGWRIVRAKRMARLEIEVFDLLSKSQRRAVEAEGMRLLKFAASGAADLGLGFT